MNEPLQDELLSAYLDGELSADERRRVERHLASSPSDRRLVEELRALSKSLQGLPRYELGARFRDDVLRRAERAMLTRPGELSLSHAAETKPRRWLPTRGLRPVIWPALAAAAAVMLMVVYRQEGPQRQEVALGRRAPVGAPAGTADRKDGGPVMRSLGSAAEGARKGAGPPTTGADVLAAAKQLATEGERLAVNGRAAKSGLVPPVQAVPDSAPLVDQPTVPADAATEMPFSYSGPARQPEVGATATTDGEGAVQQPASESINGALLRAADRNHAVRAAGDSNGGLMIVEVGMSREAAQRRAFDQLLERQQIVWSAADRWPEDREQGRPEGPRRGAPVGDAAEKRPNHAGLPPESEHGRAGSRGVERVRVEATFSQLRGALTDLKARAEEFPALEVVPDPSSPIQRTFAPFQRGRSLSRTKVDELGLADGAQLALDKDSADGAVGRQAGDGAGRERSYREERQQAEAAFRGFTDKAPASTPPVEPSKSALDPTAIDRPQAANRPHEPAGPLLQILFVLRIMDGDSAVSEPAPRHDVP